MKQFDQHFRFCIIPDELGLSSEQKKAVIDRAWYNWRQDPTNFALYMLWISAVVSCWVAGYAISRIGYVAFFSAGAVGIVGLMLLRTFRFQPLVWAELHARGHPVCPICGYPRAGLDGTPKCPECGTTLQA